MTETACASQRPSGNQSLITMTETLGPSASQRPSGNQALTAESSAGGGIESNKYLMGTLP